MSINASVSGSAGEILTLAEGDVLTVGILVALGKTEIDDEDVIFVLVISSNQKVVRLNISMNDSFFMDLLNSLNLFEII
jgi:precorrin-6B methylase 1